MSKEGKSTVVPRLRFPEFRDAEGWNIAPMGSLLGLEYGEALPEPSRRIGSVPVMGSNGTVGYHDEALIKGPAIVVGRKGSVGQINWVESDCFPIDTTYYVKNKQPSKSSMRFLLRLLQISKLEQRRDPGAVPGLNRNEAYSIETAIPEPAEQQKIADCLTSLDEVIAAQGRKVEALKTYKRGLMQQLFPREGETVPRLRFPEFRDGSEWQAKRFFDLLDGVLDFRGRTPTKLGMEWGSGDIMSLSANNVKNGFIDYDADCYFGSEELHSRWMGGTNLEKGDVIFTMEAPLGNALLVPDVRKYILSQRVVAFKTKPSIVNEFLIQLMWSDGFQSAIDLLATGSTAKGISQKALQGVLVALPGSKDEQRRVAQCLSPMDDEIAAETKKLCALKTHKKGLMQQLFPSAVDI
jgi:type I restriction enzyme, S subunit